MSRIVEDGVTEDDCSIGGGTFDVLCTFNGTDTWTPGGGGGGAITLQQAFQGGKAITGANSEPNCFRVGDGPNYACMWWDATLGFRFTTNPISDLKMYIPTNKNGGFYDQEGECFVEKIDPDAASPNAAFQYECTGLKPLLSIYPSLNPRGAVTIAEESLNTNFEKRYWATVTDVDTDALDFHFPVTLKMVGATTITVRLVGASKHASPSGNIVFSCAATAVRPGTDTYAAHSTTGEQTVTLTPATQYRPVAATSAAITLNGTVADGGEIVGSCEVDAGGTTSAQMTDFRASADARIQLLTNSRSD